MKFSPLSVIYFLFDASFWLNEYLEFLFVVSDLGMKKESTDFAGELYDVLARRREVKAAKGITLQELRAFWEDLTREDLDSRLRIFFDLYTTLLYLFPSELNWRF